MIFYYTLLFAFGIIPCALFRRRWPHVLVFWTVGVSLVLAGLLLMGAPIVPQFIVDGGLIVPQDTALLQPVLMRNAMLTVAGAAIYVGLAQFQALRMPHALALLLLGTLYMLTQHDLLFGDGITIFTGFPPELQDGFGEDFAQRIAEQTAKQAQATRIIGLIGVAAFLGLAAYQLWLRLTRGPAGH